MYPQAVGEGFGDRMTRRNEGVDQAPRDRGFGIEDLIVKVIESCGCRRKVHEPSWIRLRTNRFGSESRWRNEPSSPHHGMTKKA